MAVPLALPHLSRPLSVVVASRNSVKINAVAAAVHQAFPGLQHSVTGAASDSGVPDQPFGDEETLLGAYNRLASLAACGEHSGSLLCAIEGGIGWAPPAPAARGVPAAADQQQRQEESVGWEPAAWQVRQQAHLCGPLGHHQQQRQQQQQGRRQHGAVQQPPQDWRQLECFAWVAVQAPGGRCSHARSASFLLPAAVSELILTQGLELGAADDRVRGRVNSGQGSGTIGKLTGGLITRQLYYQHAVGCALVPLMNPGLFPEHAGQAGEGGLAAADPAGEAAPAAAVGAAARMAPAAPGDQENAAAGKAGGRTHGAAAGGATVLGSSNAHREGQQL